MRTGPILLHQGSIEVLRESTSNTIESSEPCNLVKTEPQRIRYRIAGL